MVEATDVDIKNLEDGEYTLIVDRIDKEVLSKIGYSIQKGKLFDDEKKTVVMAEDNKEIEVENEEDLALIAGSHVFVRNIAGYADYLAKEGQLKLKEKKD